MEFIEKNEENLNDIDNQINFIINDMKKFMEKNQKIFEEINEVNNICYSFNFFIFFLIGK
jgi:hypothetical protein